MIELWHLKNIDWLAELPEDVCETLRLASDVRQFSVGDIIFEPEPHPEYVYILESGLVRIFRRSPDGEQVTFGYIRPGEVFGELAAFSDRSRGSYAAAVEPAVVLRVNRQLFAQAIKSRASIVFSVAKQIEGRFNEIETRVEDLVFKSVRSRLAHIILQLADQFSRPSGEEVVLDIRLTHAELANLIGASRPTVSLAVKEFEDAGLIGRRDGHIALLDRPRLEEIAGDDTDGMQ